VHNDKSIPSFGILLFFIIIFGGISLKKKVVAFHNVQQPTLEKLRKDFDVTYFPENASLQNESFIQAIQDAEALIGTGLKMDAELLDQAPNVKVVATVSVGYNLFDIEELTKRNIMATHTPDVLTDAVADAIFGLLVATARRMPQLDKFVKDGKWTEDTPYEATFGMDVHHKTIGIIGFGRIGQAIAQRAHHGFHMNVLYHSRTRKEDAEETYRASYCSLDDLLKKSDYVVLMTPLTKETEGLLGAREFSLMKKSAIFINGSRGQTIVEQDLIAALQNGDIAAAGLDVFEKEPVDPDNPLLQMDNVVTLPHIGSATYETEVAMSELARKNVVAALQGEKPPALINKEVWQDN